METSEESKPVKIRKSGSGGFRPGAGPKTGTAIPSNNIVIKMPKALYTEVHAKKPSIKKKGLSITKVILIGLRKELDKIEYPEGVEPVERFVPVVKKAVVKKKTVKKKKAKK